MVSVGVSVTVYDMDFDEEVEYQIVSSREVDPLENKISDQSPIGKALIGTKVDRCRLQSSAAWSGKIQNSQN